MDCKHSSQLLNAYADSELSKSDQSLLESHLAECLDCAREFEDIRKIDAQMRHEVATPGSLRSAIADRLENAKRPSRTTLKELFGMKYRIGVAALVAAGLIIFGTMSTGGVSAQAALIRMRKAVTEIHSAHLKIEITGPIDFRSDDVATKSAEKDDSGGGFNVGSLMEKGNKTIDLYSEDNKWKADIFGGIEAIYNDGFVSVVMGDKVFMKVKADDAHVPPNMTQYLFKQLSNATIEMKQKCNVIDRGEVRDGGRSLKTLEVTGIQDNGKNWHLMYWVDESTNLPARFQVFAKDDSGQEKMVANITCEFNQDYPDSIFEPGGVEKP